MQLIDAGGMAYPTQNVLTRESLAIAEEYVFYRLADGWELADILSEFGLAAPRWPSLLDRSFVIRGVAEHWLTEVAPASRAVDAEQRVRNARRDAERRRYIPLRPRRLASTMASGQLHSPA